jgi:hypothetical protein
MSDNQISPALLNTAQRHVARAEGRSSDIQIHAHETLDEVFSTLYHHGRVVALQQAITKIRELADGWIVQADESSKYGRKNDADVVQRREHAKQLNELAFDLFSKVDES